jgi:fibro-slime domain-containing protein
MKRSLSLLALTVLTCFCLAPDAAKDLKPGLLGEYFDFGSDAVEDFPAIPADKKPSLKLIDKKLDFESTSEALGNSKLEDHFYVRWTGMLRVPKDGKYKFTLESDDGSRLFIDNKMVVDNGGLHGMEEKDGEVDLKASDHPIKAELFENEGEVGMKLSWEGAGLTKEIVPTSALFHEKDKDADKD